MARKGYVYILSNHHRTTFYTGVTSNLACRLEEHRSGLGSYFTTRYKLIFLVYYEVIDGMMNAIEREKQLKRWHREWKINLIRSVNPDMKDLSDEIF